MDDNWQEIWEKLGRQETDDLAQLNGYGHCNANHKEMTTTIIEALQIGPEERVLEVGCGAGALARYIAPHCRYAGIDLSTSLVARHREILGNEVKIASANDIPYHNGIFDKVFSFGVFHYFHDKNYVKEVLREMQRVGKGGSTYIGDLPWTSTRKSHLLFESAWFQECKITSGLYEPNARYRFNALIPDSVTMERIISRL